MPRPYASGVVARLRRRGLGRDPRLRRPPHLAPRHRRQRAPWQAARAPRSGAVRRLTLGDGGVVVERLLALDDPDRSLHLRVPREPVRVRRYISTIRVAPGDDSGQTFVEWWAEFDAEAADEERLTGFFADGVYATGIGALQASFAAKE